MNSFVSEIETVFLKNKNQLPSWTQINEIQVPNRAINFGDGLFETMVFDGEQIRFGSLHLARLTRGLEILKMDPCEIDFDELESFLKEQFWGQKLRVRWNLYRAGSGKYTPNSQAVSETIQIASFLPAPIEKKSSFISSKVKLFPTLWSSCKTLNALPYILANLERQEAKMEEVILLDYRGFLSEAGASNLFWRKGDRVFTPSLACGCLDGIARKVILEEFFKQKIQIDIGEFLPSELDNADQVWTSSVLGISYLNQIGSKKYSTEPFCYIPNWIK
jgi:branched-subunit amino acid aminotransferase/4-amino-4-deoxychorismate lyase